MADSEVSHTDHKHRQQTLLSMKGLETGLRFSHNCEKCT